jgi:hypothetical protein
MPRPDEARAQELINLKVALAMFAVQLDAFEARMGVRPGIVHDLSAIRERANDVVSAMKSR